MELIFSELDVERMAAYGTAQALVEGDIPLPEGRKTAEVLSAGGAVAVTSVMVTGGAVVMEGRVRAELVCREGNEVYAFASGAQFRHSVKLEGAMEGMDADVNAALMKMDVKDGEALKLSAIVDFTILVSSGNPLRVLTGLRGAETLEMKTLPHQSSATNVIANDTVRIRGDINAANVSEVLSANGACTVREAHPEGDRVVAEGVLTVTALCEAQDGNLMQLVTHVPFTADAELTGNASGELLPEATVEAMDLRPIGKDTGMLSAEALIGLKVKRTDALTYNVPEDAYCPGQPLAGVTEKVNLVSRGPETAFRCGVTESLAVPEGMPEIGRIVCCSARAIVTNAGIADGRAYCEGLLATRVVYSGEGGTLYAFSEDIPFLCDTAYSGDYESAFAEAKVVSAMAQGAGRNVELSYTLLICMRPYTITEANVVTGLAESAEEDNAHGVVVYYAGNGETLFDVGKRFNLSRDRLKAMAPDAQEALADGQRLIMLL